MPRALLVAVATLAACNGDPGPAVETSTGTVVTAVDFSVETWPGEGIPIMEARRVHLVLHQDPDPASGVVDTITADIGARVAFDSTRYQTIEPGSISVLRETSISGRDFGSRHHLTREEYYSAEVGSTSVRVTPATSIEFLQHRAEGTCFVRLNERVINADPCPVLDSGVARLESEPRIRWWIRTRGEHGQYGWIQVSDSTVRTNGREFD